MHHGAPFDNVALFGAAQAHQLHKLLNCVPRIGQTKALIRQADHVSEIWDGVLLKTLNRKSLNICFLILTRVLAYG